MPRSERAPSTLVARRPGAAPPRRVRRARGGNPPPAKPRGRLEPQPPGEPTAISEDGTWKAKARITILGFEHPDLGSDMYKTAAPVANQITKSLLKLKAVTDKWTMEKADATSAFLQTSKSLEERQLWTWGVPELSKALGAAPFERW